MADPRLTLRPYLSSCKSDNEFIVSDNGSTLNDSPQQSGLAFGLQVQQHTPKCNLIRPISDEIIHDLRGDSCYRLIPVTVIDTQEPYPGEPLDLSIKSKTWQKADQSAEENKNSSSQSESTIVRVLSRAVEESFHSDNSHQDSNAVEQVSSMIQAGNSSNEYGLKSPEQINDNKASRSVSQRERQRERYRNDPAYAKRQRERYQNDTVHAQGQRIYVKIYNQIKRQTSNKEEARKQASIAREQYRQSVKTTRHSGNLLLTSNLAETTPNSSNNSDGAPPAFQTD